MDTLFASFIEIGAGIFFGRELFSCTIDDFSMFVWRMLGSGWHRMAMLAEDMFNVSVHGEPTGAFRIVGSVVSLQVNTGKLGALPVCDRLVVFAKDCQ